METQYLFLLAAKGLVSLLKYRCQSSNLHGLKVAMSAPTVSHLLFADDGLLVFKADTKSGRQIVDVLDRICNASRSVWISHPSFSVKDVLLLLRKR